jgi:hypothetical protein
VTGTAAVKAATPTVADLNKFAKNTPDLAQNLAIVLHDLDDPSRAVEPDPRSPGGKGFTGLQALLGYVFNQTLAVNYYGPLGHILGVDAFFSTMCSNYETPATIAMQLKQNGPQYRKCYSWLGPNQPGVNETDPSDPSAPVPDPGGAPPGERGPATSASKLEVSTGAKQTSSPKAAKSQTTTGPTKVASVAPGSGSSSSGSSSSGGSGSSGGGSGTGGLGGIGGGPPINLPKTLGEILSGGVGGLTGASAAGGSAAPSASRSAPASSASGSAPASSGNAGTSSGQAQALLNYLLTP